jgi:alpha-tubulin suppressor-like RCC1 family protein
MALLFGLALSSTVPLGCAANIDDGADHGLIGQAQAAINVVPQGVACIVVHVKGSTDVSLPFGVSGSSQTILSLGYLPLGSATIDAAAFNSTCDTVTDSSHPQWISDPVRTYLVAGATPQINLVLRPNQPRTVSVDFQQSAGNLGIGYNASYATLASDGSVSRWGQIQGAGTFTTPSVFAGLSSPSQFAVGFYHACALDLGGSVNCWGMNLNGELGDGSTTSHDVAYAVKNLKAVDIAAGFSHTCAVTNAGGVSCWGSNSSGQLGVVGGDQLLPVAVPGLAQIAGISAGNVHTCARTLQGTVRCWGLNSSGQLGTGSLDPNPSKLLVPSLYAVAEIAAGATHTCARKADGSVWCWGSNGSGELGDGSGLLKWVPVPVSSISTAVQIAAGGNFTCARLADTTVRCWGANTYGQLGDGSGVNQLTPTAVEGLYGVAEIGVGSGHACARLVAGNVVCWGANNVGQLGDGTFEYHAVPTPVRW